MHYNYNALLGILGVLLKSNLIIKRINFSNFAELNIKVKKILNP